MKRWTMFGILAAVFTAATLPVCGAGLIIVDDTSWRPGPIPPHPIPPIRPPRPIPPFQPHIFAPLEVNSVKAHARITDQVAVTTVDQEFYNPNHSRLEGTFIFPIPRGAQLDRFTLQIDGKPAEAELLAADKARRIYEDIVRRERDPALMEYAGQDVFKVRIFPIEPRSTKRISLSYTQVLKEDNGLLNYLLPMSTEKYSAKPVRNLSVKIELESKRPIKTIYSPSHAVEIRRDKKTSATVGFEARGTVSDSDFALYFAMEKDPIGLSLLTHRINGSDGYFLLLASPGVEVNADQVIPKDILFVLDTSGSMAGRKLDQARKALLFCLDNLNDADRFEVVRFSTEVEPLFDKLAEANRPNRTRAEEFVKGLKPMGGTAIDDALSQALKSEFRGTDTGRPRIIIFLTDGRPTIGVTDEDQILAHVRNENANGCRVFCFGIGTDVNTHLLDKITGQTRAFSQYVLPEEDLEIKVSSFFTKIKEPVLANPTLSFQGGIRATKLYPSPLPDLFKGEQLVLAGRYSGDGDCAIILEGLVNGKTRKFIYESVFLRTSPGNEFIARLWATRRIGFLLDEIRLKGENPELRDEVADLARNYGIVTPYTAYLIVEDEARRNVPEPMRSLQDFDRDREAQREASRAWSGFQRERGGLGGVSGARYSMALKSANAPAAATADSAMEAQRALGMIRSPGMPDPVSSSDDKARLVQYSQQTRYVAGRNFFQNKNQWTDTRVQNAKDMKHVRILFSSPDYFDLAEKNPEALPWLALGQNVQFVLRDTVYDIYAE